MLLPGSFKNWYDEFQPTLEKGCEYLKGRLAAELSEFDPVTIQVRPKSASSLYAKLQRGEAASALDVDDLIAARGVFLHSALAHGAMAAVRTIFRVIEARNVDAGKPTDFRYQQPHLIAKLPAEYVARHADLSNIKVEFQFTTYVQHALQESTHDVIYKGTRFSWREHRLDARLRGVLEIVDDVLANLTSVADIGQDPPYELFERRNEIVAAANASLSGTALPDDMRRFVVTVEGLLAALDISPAGLTGLFESNSDLAGARSLTAADKVLGIVLRMDAERLLAKTKPRKFVVTPELETLVPEATSIPRERRVVLSPTPLAGLVE